MIASHAGHLGLEALQEVIMRKVSVRADIDTSLRDRIRRHAELRRLLFGEAVEALLQAELPEAEREAAESSVAPAAAVAD